MDFSPPGSSLHGISQARMLEWVAMPSSRGSFQPRDQGQVSRIAGRFFTIWTTSEAQGLYLSNSLFFFKKINGETPIDPTVGILKAKNDNNPNKILHWWLRPMQSTTPIPTPKTPNLTISESLETQVELPSWHAEVQSIFGLCLIALTSFTRMLFLIHG